MRQCESSRPDGTCSLIATWAGCCAVVKSVPWCWTAAAPQARATSSPFVVGGREVAREQGVARPHGADDLLDGGRPVHDPGRGDQDRAVAAEAGQHGLRAAGPQLLGGVDHVADGGDGAADGVGQLVGVRLDQIGPGRQRRDEGRPRGVDHDTGARAVAGLDEPGVELVGETAGQAAAARDPPARSRLGVRRREQRVALGVRQRRAPFVDLGDDAVGLDDADVDADLARDRHRLVVQPGPLQHLHEVRARRSADGQHGHGGPLVGLEREGDVDALAARLAPAPGPVGDLARAQRVDEDRAVHGGVGGDGDDHVFSVVSPAAFRASSSAAGMPVSVMSRSRSASSPYLCVETWLILLWSASRMRRRAQREHEALDGGFGRVRRGEAAVRGDAVGAQEGDVDVDLPERAGGPGVDLGERDVPDAAAERVDGDVGLGRQRERDRQGVGERGQLPVGRDELGQQRGGGARVDQDRAGAGEVRERGLGDAPLLLRELDPGGDLGLEGEVLQRDRAAVDAPELPLAFERDEVLAHGLAGDGQLLRHRRDVDPTGRGQRGEDGLLALLGVERLVVGRRHREGTGGSIVAGRG